MATAKRVGVVLSGCGFLDGSEIHEATLTLLAIDQRGARAVPMAPDVQADVVNHATREPTSGQQRRVLVESARIARGPVKSLAEVKASELDALIFPGGYGAAKNLCTFAADGPKMRVLPEVERLVREMHAANKPMGFVCISPVIAARLLGERKVELTIGNDEQTAKALEAMGARHVERKVDEVAVDARLKVVSTPAYMYDASIAQVFSGIEKLVSAVLELA